MNKAVFLDRDGVINDAIIINDKPYAPCSIEELSLSDEVLPSLAKLKEDGYLLIVATNQPDVARGKVTKTTVESIHQLLMKQLPLDEIFVCYHDESDHCHCRKPLPGLILDAAKKYQIDITQSFMIGDRWKDITAGQCAGCKTIWIDRHYAEQKPTNADAIVNSIAEASDYIVAMNGK